MAELRKARLETWKEVASFFGKDERTVKRWEAERGLPVRRLPGASRSRIYAEVEELELWLRGASGSPLDEAVPSHIHASTDGKPGRALLPWLLAAGGLAAALAVVAVLAWPRLHAPAPIELSSASSAPAPPPSLAAQRLYLAGMDDWARRTPEGLRRAVEEFSQAIKLSPSYAEAYVGLANCYNLLREYTLMPPSQAYPLARGAARHALALNDRLSSAHVALAFVYSYWDWDLPGARREYERAIALDPTSDLNHHWYATFLSARGEFAKSLAEFDKAEALAPNSLSIKADHGVVLFGAGRRTEGMSMMLAVENTDPKFLSPHRYLANAYLLEGRNEDFLREARIAANLTGDRQRLAQVEAAGAGLAQGGRQGMLNALLNEQLRQFQDGVVPAYNVAASFAMLGRSDEALAYLQTAIDRRESDVVGMNSDQCFAALRALPQFKAMASNVKPANAAQSRAVNS